MAENAPKQGVGYWLLKHGGFTVLTSVALLYAVVWTIVHLTGSHPAGSAADNSTGSQTYSQAAAAPSTQSAAPAAAAPVSSSPPSPAQMLADLDGDSQPVSEYQAALDALGPKCTQDEEHIAALGNAGYSDLTKNGISDETRLTVLQHLSASIPADLGKTDCASMLSAYLVLREQG